MKRIIITDARFPASEISHLAVRYKADIVSLDGHPSVPISGSPLVSNTIDLWKIWTNAYHLAQNWYVLGGEDITEYGSISFGKIVEIEMWYYWRGVLERIETIKRIIDATSPNQIYLATLDNDTIKRLIVGLLGPGAKITMVSPPLRSWLTAWRDPECVRDRLKQWEIDRYARLLALGLKKSSQRRRQGEIGVLGLLEQPGDYLADSILPVLSLFSDSAVLLMDHRHRNKVTQAGHRCLYFSDFVTRHISSFLRYRKIFTEKWKAFQELLSVSLPKDDVDLWPVAKRRIYRLFWRKFPIVGVEIEAARELLLKYQVKSLLLTSDAHHSERLFTLIANQLGIPSLVTQHGATLGEWGYVPLYATRFAAWGEMSKQWLMERGVASDRIVVTGSPRLDNLIGKNFKANQEETCSRLGLPDLGYLLLWVMDPIPKLQNQEIFEQLNRVVAALPWLCLVIRPHPGIPQLSWIVDIVEGQERIVVSPPQESLYEVLNVVDGVVVQGSTVGIEAMLFDKPVVVFQPGITIIQVGILYDEAAIKVTTIEELRQTIEDLYQVKRENGVDRYAQARHKFVKQYFDALDGNSAHRVAQALSELMGGHHSTA